MTTETLSAAASGTWKLGDLTVNRMGLGAMRLTQKGAAFDDAAAPSDRDRAIAVLRRAVELGVNHIDTAAFYFSSLRSANELINRALGSRPDDVVVVTKVGPSRDASGEWLPWARPEQLRGQVEENLRELGRDHLDVVNLRTQGPGPIAEHFGALVELREKGLIRHLGLSNVRPEQFAEAREIAPVVCVQNWFAVGSLRPGSAEMLRICGEEGIAFVPFYSIAGERREAGAGDSERPEILEVARAHGVSAVQVRLAWTLQQGPHVLVIPGTGNPVHLEANVAAGALRLTPEEMALLG
ncbi:aldo/keto reductase [Streptomyces sp. NPDC088270]|uniref:aldo/keto reductase n=1 Tax=unclassified Streptomyces TaxID=2593676 RepID=UPI00343CE7BA